MNWVLGRQTPDNSLMRFVRCRFPYTGTFLDIGSGEGANARELATRGHRVFSIDKDRFAPIPVKETPTWHQCVDVCEHEFKGPYDLIYDVNALCHVEDPPFQKIKEALKPGGIFFSICPTDFAPDYITVGKKFTRRLSEFDLRYMLKPYFEGIRLYFKSEPDFKSDSLDSWIVEAGR